MIQNEILSHKKFISQLLTVCIIFIWVPETHTSIKYIAKPFKTLKYTPDHFEDYQQQVTMRAKRLQPHEAQRLLSDRACRLYRSRRQFIPVQLSFSNKGTKGWIISSKSIGLPTLNAHQIYKRIKRQTGGRILGIFGCGTVGFLGSLKGCAVASSTFLFMHPWGLVACGAVAVSSVAFLLGTPILSLTHGLGCAKANDALLADIKTKILHHDIVLFPGSHYECLIFVEKKYYKEPFAIKLCNTCDKHDTLIFNVSHNNR